MALQWKATLEGPCSFVRLLHRQKVSIFQLSIHIASELFAPCISATFVPGKVTLRMYANFHWKHYTALQWTATLEGPCSFVSLLNRQKVSIFKLFIPTASELYANCISTTIVPG